MMKVAVPMAGGLLCMHFGHCEKFMIFEVEKENAKIVSHEELVPPPHEPGLLPRWLAEKGVKLVIAGGMGQRAQDIFGSCGINVITGAPAVNAELVVLNWLEGSLETGSNACDH